MKVFSASEVSKHNREDNGWIVIDGDVYNITVFLEAHPGGKRILLPLLGKDATKEFRQYHSVATVLTKYSKLKIGQLDSKVLPDDSGLDTSDMYGDLVAFGDPAWYQGWKSPYYKESHKRLRHWVRTFVDKELLPFINEWEESGKVPQSVYERCGEVGLLTACFGKWESQYAPCQPPGGVKVDEWDAFHNLVIGDEFARVASFGVASAINLGPSIALPPVHKFGSDEMRKRVCTQVLHGKKTICLAITEPYAGSDVANIQTVAVPDGNDGWLISGEKKWITNGAWADYFVVAARTGKPGMGGLTLFLIERGVEGLRTRPVHCQGNRGSGTAFVIMENVRVTKKDIIGGLNKGFKCIMYNFNTERMGICVGSIRSARICYEEAMKYANKRKTFGKYLFEHGVIRNKLAHMARQIEAAQSWLEALTYQMDYMPAEEANIKLGGPIALLKAQSTQIFEYCAREASQILGGIAYTRGGVGEKVERLYRDVRGVAIPGGSEEIMLDLGIRQALKVSQFMGAKI